MTTQSNDLFDSAKDVLIGGVNSPVRAFKAVGKSPIYMKSGRGPYLMSADDQEYIDYVLSWGPMILGHAYPSVVEKVQAAVANGSSFGTPSELETQLSLLIRDFFPSCERLRLVSSGTEATMSAIRLARGYTNRKLIVKCDGCYHGHVDSLLVSAGSGALSFGTPDSSGVPEELAQLTRVLPFNDSEAFETLFKEQGDQIAAVIIEPVCGNMGLVLPDFGFLEGLQMLCSQYGALLIFDEVMTGFRVSLGGVQEKLGITPDLTCLGKVVGGGFPCAAYGGKKEIMSFLSPEGPVYQAGTLSGNPIAMTAGIETLTQLQKTEAFSEAEENTSYLVAGLMSIFGDAFQIHRAGTMFSYFLSPDRVNDLVSAKKSDQGLFSKLYHHLLDQGIYMAPSPFESNFMSSVHTKKELDYTLEQFHSFFSNESS